MEPQLYIQRDKQYDKYIIERSEPLFGGYALRYVLFLLTSQNVSMLDATETDVWWSRVKLTDNDV